MQRLQGVACRKKMPKADLLAAAILSSASPSGFAPASRRQREVGEGGVGGAGGGGLPCCVVAATVTCADARPGPGRRPCGHIHGWPAGGRLMPLSCHQPHWQAHGDTPQRKRLLASHCERDKGGRNPVTLGSRPQRAHPSATEFVWALKLRAFSAYGATSMNHIYRGRADAAVRPALDAEGFDSYGATILGRI